MSARAGAAPALRAYRAASWALLGPFAGPWLRARAAKGKEDPARLKERFGRASAPRPPGLLVWLHAASVGEAGVALQLRAGLAGRRADASFLITTGTCTSAAIVARAAAPRTIHQFAPLDRPDIAARFIAHWRPDLGVFIESEIWPNLILAARAARTPLALVNGRVSPETLRNWARAPASAAQLLNAFDPIVAADRRTAEGIATLAARTPLALGNLKFAAPAPPIDVAAHSWLSAQIAGRPVWLAASTHAGEEDILLNAHDQIRLAVPEALLIIAPRHPERGAEIAALARGAPRRSKAEPIGEAGVYVADTLGEMGAMYAAAPIALIAGSLRPELKGHNPMEPAKIGCAILSGPHVESFEEAFEALVAAGGARIVDGAAAIATAVTQLWADPAAADRLRQAGAHIASEAGPALVATLDALDAALPARGAVRARA